MTREQAELEVDLELAKRNPTRKMSPNELLVFCQEMQLRLEFPTNGDRMQDIRAWADRWEGIWLRTCPMAQ